MRDLYGAPKRCAPSNPLQIDFFSSLLEDYKHTLHLRPDDPDAFNDRGIARRAKGDLDGAIQDFNEATRLQPDTESNVWSVAANRQTKSLVVRENETTPGRSAGILDWVPAFSCAILSHRPAAGDCAHQTLHPSDLGLDANSPD